MNKSLSCELSFSIIRGNSRELVKQLPQVDCVITSPPYYQQRLYGPNASELGREPSVGEYIGNLVELFTAIALAPWASVWVNIGDKRGKHGELLRIPHLFTTAMAEAGFFLIDEVVWAKESVRVDGTSVGHCMIEPATRRLNGNGHEPFYRFVRDPCLAWTDMSAVRIPRKNVEDVRYLPENLMRCHTSLEGRSLPNVWNVGTGKTNESHYAVFDSALIERPVAMSCPFEITEEGPKRRKIEMVPYEEFRPNKRGIGKYTKPEQEIRSKSGRQDTGRQYVARKPVTVGWAPGLPALRRGTVLDPFAGTATAGEVSIKLGRNFIGFELTTSMHRSPKSGAARLKICEPHTNRGFRRSNRRGLSVRSKTRYWQSSRMSMTIPLIRNVSDRSLSERGPANIKLSDRSRCSRTINPARRRHAVVFHQQTESPRRNEKASEALATLAYVTVVIVLVSWGKCRCANI